MKTNHSQKDLFSKMKKATLFAILCAGGIAASAQTIGGNVYGGGNAAEVEQNTVVTIKDGAINSVFGGGRMANVKGYADVLVVGGTIGNVFGGNDINGSVQGKGDAPTSRNGISTDAPTTNAFVRIDQDPKIAKVFGGGNGDYDYTLDEYEGMSVPTLSKTYVMVDMTADGAIDSAVFGGGNATTVDSTEIHVSESGKIHYIFGGGNAATVLDLTKVYVAAASTISIDTLFGGNNKAQMDILPYIDLASGNILAVYGGGNAGGMNAKSSAYNKDIFNEDISDLSTYLYIYSDQISINDVYGGCRDAQVTNNTFIDIRNTKNAITNVFGGNDHGGNVFNTRIDAVGGKITNLYGASNGNYFIKNDNSRDLTYVFPNCDTTRVNIYGGEFTNIYGGGYAGNVTGDTYLLLNDQIGGTNTAKITGNLFGGGYGYEPYALSNATNTENVGNVAGTAYTDAKHITNLTDVKLYGGGNAGDVKNTLLTVYPTWDQPLKEIYGGCRASNVTELAHTILQPSELQSTWNSKLVFGGNDFAGTTNNSILDIYSGHYNHVYGAGNGNYDYENYTALQAIAEADRNYIPVSRDVNTNLYNGTIDSNLYGCSEMGYVYKNITPSSTSASSEISDYSTIITNIHGGTINNDVFGGAHGRLGHEQLVYGIKIINMDGGVINYSIHGGSESVNDGYPNECIDTTNTTKRPSSVVNITGGNIRNRSFGGGYMGQIYGSTYFNVGKYAVDSCEVWSKTYNGTANAYASLKPDSVTNAPEGAQLMVNDIALEKSIYSGADWGTSGEVDASSLYYNRTCFHGGKSELSIDGRGYNSSSNTTHLPFITLNESLYGSGTSSEGGDINRIIKLKNFGDPYGCEYTYRSLKSIQRADSLTIQNVDLELLGAPSNVALYSSPNFSISRIDKEVRFVDQNFIKLDAAVNQIGALTFYKHTSPTEITLVSSDELKEKTITSDNCDNLTVCDWRGENENDFPGYTTLYMMQGNYIEVRQWKDVTGGENNTPDNLIDDDAPYGPVLGYAYFVTESDYSADIIARPQRTSTPLDGGFMSNCKGNNNYNASDPSLPTDPTENETEMEYSTPDANYRVWNLNNGLNNRRRNVNIIAHNEPEMLPGIDSAITYVYSDGTNTNTCHLATAIADISLPPSAPGHYYKIESVIIDNETRSLGLVNAGMSYNNGDPTTAEWFTDGAIENAYTSLSTEAQKDTAIAKSIQSLGSNPQNKFGLTLQGWDNFVDNDPRVISGNVWTTNNPGSTCAITGTEGVIPTARLTLTYDPTFSANTQRTVTLKMVEYDADGNELDPLEIVVTIETLTKTLGDNSVVLLAMYNDGITNEYNKNILIPATQKDYDFYLNKIEWKWANPKWNEEDQDTLFALRPNTTVTNDNYPDSIFSLKFKLSEDISSVVQDNNAWRSLTDALTDRTGDFCELAELTGAVNKQAEKSFTSDDNELGLLLAELDSRFTAAINVGLTFNGNILYPRDTIVGNAKLTFKAKNRMNDEAAETFTISIYVKTRDMGDTIYLASANSVIRDGITLYPWNYNPVMGSIDPEIKPDPLSIGEDNSKVKIPGKMPDRYVQNINDAFDADITGYLEGDVICVIDTVNLKSEHICRGSEYNLVQIVRYDGSHFTFPGEDCAYRGPLFRLSDGASLSTWNIRYDGKGISRISVNSNEDVKASDIQYTTPRITNKDDRIADLNDAVEATYSVHNSNNYFHRTPQGRDTTISFGPVFLLTDENTTLTLNDNSYVVNNFNLAAEKEQNNSATIGSGKSYSGGAIVVRGTQAPRIATNSPDKPRFAGTPMVELVNNVEISGNLVMNPKDEDGWTNEARGAGIEVENGVVLLYTHKDAAITVKDNYYVPYSNTTITNGLTQDATTQKFAINNDYLAENNFSNNIHLTRTVGTVTSAAPLDDNDRVFNDNINDIVYFRSELSKETEIGINKWFPALDPYYRDTIQFAMAVASQTRAERAFLNNNFPSDSAFDQIYHIAINPFLDYYKRCTGFRLQDTLDRTHFPEDLAAIRFDPEAGTDMIPTYDKLSVRVKGGLFPRTYTWYQINDDNSLTEIYKDTSKYSNAEIKRDLSGDYRRESNTGSYRLANMTTINPTKPQATYKYRVKAIDLLGCPVTKDVQVVIAKAEPEMTPEYTLDPTSGDPFEATAPVPGYWIDSTYTVNNNDSIAGDHSSYNTSTDADKQVNILRTVCGVKVHVKLVPENGGIATATMDGIDTLTTTDVNDGIFTPGDVLKLNAEPNEGKQFMYWDYDPYAPHETEYIVPSKSTEVSAFFSPNKHWHEVVTTKPEGYRTDYGGNIHISSKEGLAWLISVVNGLNGQQPRTMYFDTIFIDPAGDYSMEDYLWTPVGTEYQNFMGAMMAEGGNPTTVFTIDSIILNEPKVNNVGFFGIMDGAVVNGINLTNATALGLQYVGTLAAKAQNNSIIDNVKVDKSTAITSYASGGLVGNANDSKIENSTVETNFIGSAIYNGGIAGTAENGSEIKDNNSTTGTTLLTNAIYQGGIAGYTTSDENCRDTTITVYVTENYQREDGEWATRRVGKQVDTVICNNNTINNNFVATTSNTANTVNTLGGIVGKADNTVMLNNYVYGNNPQGNTIGAIVGQMGDNVNVSNCFYETGMAATAVGATIGENQVTQNVTTFNGEGNHVTVSQTVGGVNNLTRILNNWVRQQPEESNYNTWRSDLENVNNGYPIFGTPDIIPVYDTIEYTTCDFYEWNGEQYYESGAYSRNFINQEQYIDSTVTLLLTINSAMLSSFEDSVQLGLDYYGYGFNFSATEQELLRNTIETEGFATIEFFDTLQTVHGCDSVISLTLTVYDGAVNGTVAPEAVTVKVYPNPTTSIVNVEATGLKEVEVYDNASRRIADSKVDSDHCIINLNNNASGSYYLRIYTKNGVAIRKVIKK